MKHDKVLTGLYAEGFGYVPKLLVKDDTISLTTKMFLVCLIVFSGNTALCWVSHQKIMQFLKISKRTLSRSVNEAIKAGLISRSRNFSRGLGSRNYYELLFMDSFWAEMASAQNKKRVFPRPLEGPSGHSPYNNKQI